MTDKKKTRRKAKGDKEKPEEDSFGLDIGFEEALERFLQVKPSEVTPDDRTDNTSQKSNSDDSEALTGSSE